MSAVDLVTLLCGLLAMCFAASLAVLAGRVLRSVQALNAATELFLAEAVPAVQELREAAGRASSEVDRIDDLLEVAGAIGDRAARRLRGRSATNNEMVRAGSGRGS